MVIKGSARGAPGELAHHLLREDTNERVRVLAMSGVASLDLAGALAEIDAMGSGSRSTRRLYHASINTAVDETLSPEQQRRARERLAEGLGLTGQPYVMVEHVKAGRPHWHVVWGRIDQENGKAISDSHNYRKHEEAGRELEAEFGHHRVQGAHVRDKQNEPRPERGPSWGEQRQAERSGLTPAEAKDIVTAVWKRTETGREFQQGLEAEGFTLARGDRRDFVLLDAAGEVHGLSRRIEGAKAKDVRERMADVDAEQLPDVEAARRQLKARQLAVELEAGQDFVSAAELVKDQDEQERPAWSSFEREAAAAVAQLNKTMGNELAGVIVSDDKRRADKTPGQILRETETIEDRWGRELAQRQADNLARIEQRAEDTRKAARDLAGEKQKAEATGGGSGRRPGIETRPQRIGAELQRSVTPEPQSTPARDDQAEPKRSFWQRLFGRRQDTTRQDQEPKRADFGGTRVAGALPEAIQRASVEVEKQPEPSKAAETERQRPSFHLFVRIFGAIIDAYQQALDRHNMERGRVEAEKRKAWRDHANDVRAVHTPRANDMQPAQGPTPAAATAKKQDQDQAQQQRQQDDERTAEIEAARALRRLREQEEREEHERENYRL